MTNDNGIQLWTVPATGSYTIRAVGAGVPYNASYTGNGNNEFQKGMDATITTTLTKGEVIMILVGQSPDQINSASAGAGGTFVVGGSQSSPRPIIVAGGGGGRGRDFTVSKSNANISNNGQTSSPTTVLPIYGGIGGTGGGGGGVSITNPDSSAGAGLIGNGTASYFSGTSFSFINGGWGTFGHVTGFIHAWWFWRWWWLWWW